MAAGARRRFLPAWMGAAGNERAASASSPEAGRRQRRRGRAAAGPRAVLHCVNEAELVEVALEVLAENLQGTQREEKPLSGSQEEQELQATPMEAPGSTASTVGGNNCSPALPSPPDAGADAERTNWEDSEDDVLKYVREIFFS